MLFEADDIHFEILYSCLSDGILLGDMIFFKGTVIHCISTFLCGPTCWEWESCSYMEIVAASSVPDTDGGSVRLCTRSLLQP